MAIFRKIHTSFWSDSFTSELERDKKLFYLYLLTNERTTQCGIYEITKKQISYDLGYSIDTVSKLIKEFEKLGKIKYNDTTKEIAIKNWLKYNSSTSPKVQSCINKELKSVKDTLLIQYLNSIDTYSQEEEEQEQEEEEIKENIYASFDHLKITDKEFEKLIKAGFNKNQIDTVIGRIQNYAKNKNYKSLYLTSLDWLKRDFKQVQTPATDFDLDSITDEKFYLIYDHYKVPVQLEYQYTKKQIIEFCKQGKYPKL